MAAVHAVVAGPVAGPAAGPRTPRTIMAALLFCGCIDLCRLPPIVAGAHTHSNNNSNNNGARRKGFHSGDGTGSSSPHRFGREGEARFGRAAAPGGGGGTVVVSE